MSEQRLQLWQWSMENCRVTEETLVGDAGIVINSWLLQDHFIASKSTAVGAGFQLQDNHAGNLRLHPWPCCCGPELE